MMNRVGDAWTHPTHSFRDPNAKAYRKLVKNKYILRITQQVLLTLQVIFNGNFVPEKVRQET